MLEMTGNLCMGGPESVEFFENLADMIDEEIKTDEFCDQYTAAVNRLRYGVLRDIPREPKLKKGRNGKAYDRYCCGNCGYIIQTTDKFCPNCGQRQTEMYLGRRRKKDE